MGHLTSFKNTERKYIPSKIPKEDILYWQKKWGLLNRQQSTIIMLPGRLTRLKGHDVFIMALNEIRDLDWLVVCVGDADDNSGYRSELEQLSASLQFDDKLRFVGHCDNSHGTGIDY